MARSGGAARSSVARTETRCENEDTGMWATERGNSQHRDSGGEGVPLGVPESGRRRTAGTETTKERRSAELGGRGGQT